MCFDHDMLVYKLQIDHSIFLIGSKIDLTNSLKAFKTINKLRVGTTK